MCSCLWWALHLLLTAAGFVKKDVEYYTMLNECIQLKQDIGIKFYSVEQAELKLPSLRMKDARSHTHGAVESDFGVESLLYKPCIRTGKKYCGLRGKAGARCFFFLRAPVHKSKRLSVTSAHAPARRCTVQSGCPQKVNRCLRIQKHAAVAVVYRRSIEGSRIIQLSFAQQTVSQG